MRIRLLNVARMGLEDAYENGDVVEMDDATLNFVKEPGYGVTPSWREKGYWEELEPEAKP